MMNDMMDTAIDDDLEEETEEEVDKVGMSSTDRKQSVFMKYASIVDLQPQRSLFALTCSDCYVKHHLPADQRCSRQCLCD